MTDTLTLDRLNVFLNKAGVDDHEIIGGVEFTRSGYQKLAVEMGVDLKGIQLMINSLITKLRADHKQMSEAYDALLDEDTDERFSYEKDWLGNVTVRDNESGNETFLQGSEAAEMINAIESGIGNEQDILAHYMEHSVIEEDAGIEDENSYEEEIDSDRGTYNFPWKVGSAHGTATADYSGKNKIKIVSVRDADGDEMRTTSDLEDALLKQAVAFIEKA